MVKGNKKFFFLIILLVSIFGWPFPSLAQNVDSDSDGLLDEDEKNLYHTNPHLFDSDGDGWNDGQEIKNGYNPLGAGKLADLDSDQDGLSDLEEIEFQTDFLNPDSDQDGYSDGREIRNNYDPLKKAPVRLEKTIRITISTQKLGYFLGKKKLGEFTVSTGKTSMPTPLGEFTVDNKSPRAWSAAYGLWMPWWLALKNGYFGIHELPEWPNGAKEGADHLGQRVSHGCIRLGIGPAKEVYDWAEIGTKVLINN